MPGRWACLAWLVGGCGPSATPPPYEAELLEELVLPWADSRLDLGDRDVRYAEDVHYGAADEQRFDLWLPSSGGEATGLVIYVHGGGFVATDEDRVVREYGPQILDVLDAGHAYASVHYRLISDDQSPGAIQPMGDVRSALQFVRLHADELGIDPDRIVMYGNSAGAATALWLGTHDDMADPKADHPVLRQSSRPAAVGLYESQATYDLLRWEEDVFADLGVTTEGMRQVGLEGLLLMFYGMDSIDDLHSDEVIAYRATLDMLAHLDGSDAPLYVESVNVEAGYPRQMLEILHHPNHARTLQEHAERAGVPVQAQIPELDVHNTRQTMVEFLVEHAE